jgi:SAM-dependent methyltransferase
MNTQPRPDSFLDTTSSAAARWDRLLNLQVELFLSQELVSFAQIPAWTAARTVLDLGCGNGYYLARLRAAYPEKDYLGIDRSPELIDIARTTHGGARLHFAIGDLHRPALPHPVDIVLLRFVIQHLNDLGSLLTTVGPLLSKGGALIVIEPDLPASRVSPAIPLLLGMLRAFEGRQERLGKLRVQLDRLAAIVDRTAGWRAHEERSVASQNVQTAAAVFLGWVDACEQSGGFDYPFSETRAEIFRWAGGPNATSEIALRIILAHGVTPSGGRGSESKRGNAVDR